jgi:hypothetical protein
MVRRRRRIRGQAATAHHGNKQREILHNCGVQTRKLFLKHGFRLRVHFLPYRVCAHASGMGASPRADVACQRKNAVLGLEKSPIDPKEIITCIVAAD